MRFFYLTFLLISFTELFGQNLTDKVANNYCQELSKIDTLTQSNFEHILPELDQKIIFGHPDWIVVIAKEVTERNMTFKDFYVEVYTKISKTCPAYQALYKTNEIKLIDEDFFTNAYCDCFNEKTGGRIDNDNLTPIMNACNQELSSQKIYKKKVKQELKNKEISKDIFSNTITANFLTQCDLIVNHLFSYRANMMAIQSDIKFQEWKILRNRK